MKKFAVLIALMTTFTGIAQNREDGLYANFKTSKGDFLCVLEFEKAPMTVANFVALAEGKLAIDTVEVTEPFYEGVIFHRVVPNFVIQAGMPKNTNLQSPGYKFPDEFDSTLLHTDKGILSMANAGPGTNSSQFFVTMAPTPHLNFRHSVFGHVIEGYDVVEKIEQQKDSIITIEIIRVGKKAKKFRADRLFPQLVEEKKEEARLAIQNQNINFKKEMQKTYPDAVQTESGLMYEIIQEGNGTYPANGQVAEVHYTGTFVDGKKFDSSLDRNQSFDCPVGQGRVIKGWDEGIPLCSVGGKIRLIIPYWLAYGENGRASIPPKSTLIFEVEVLSIK